MQCLNSGSHPGKRFHIGKQGESMAKVEKRKEMT